MSKLSQRTTQFIDAFKKEGFILSLPEVDIVNSPWHEGYQNKSMQKSPSALINIDECKKGKILEGCSSIQYSVGDEVFTANDKRSIPAEYRDVAKRVVDISKIEKKFGSNWANVYYNLQDKTAILSQPEDVIKKSFNRFVKDQSKVVIAELGDGIPVQAFEKQMNSDFESGEYLKYAEDIIGHFPGGVALSEKAKAHIAEYRNDKKENSGLDVQAIAYAMGGSVDSKMAKDAGIFLLSFDTEKSDVKKQSSIGATLMGNIQDMTEYAGELIGAPEGNGPQKIFVSKDVADEATGKTSIAILYTDLQSENIGEVDAAVKKAVKDCLCKPFTVDISSDTYQPLESQVENAKAHYTLDTGTWMSDKSLKKPIIDTTNAQAQLRSDLVAETNVDDKAVGMNL